MSALFLDSSCSRSPILKRCVLSMVKFNLLPFAVFYIVDGYYNYKCYVSKKV